METELFDPADFLSSETALVEYVNAALETGDPAFVARSLEVVARVRGVPELSIAPTLELGTVLRVMQALGLRLMVTPAEAIA